MTDLNGLPAQVIYSNARRQFTIKVFPYFIFLYMREKFNFYYLIKFWKNIIRHIWNYNSRKENTNEFFVLEIFISV